MYSVYVRKYMRMCCFFKCLVYIVSEHICKVTYSMYVRPYVCTYIICMNVLYIRNYVHVSVSTACVWICMCVYVCMCKLKYICVLCFLQAKEAMANSGSRYLREPWEASGSRVPSIPVVPKDSFKVHTIICSTSLPQNSTYAL